MKITVSHQDAMRFEAKTEKSSFIIDCPQISPIEYFLSGIITCSATDVVMLPKQQGYEVKNLEVSGEVVRNESAPRKFNALHLEYRFDSNADDTLAARWVMASLETYCSTINTIRDTTAISYTIIHNGTVIRENEKMISGGGSAVDFGTLQGCNA
ncbi:MAG: osmotically inducible protein OsmC [Sulfuricurvum sp. RIFOXYD2_FULL_44_160]|uniref:Osmotically inducible protein OsmC n=2 Tax=Sulfuricurvum TaxID=286130 RepID=A0A2D3WEX7_9BACT|nr:MULTISPECIES: OsmC family protein [Sulfuricurvum]OHD92427.1 MAG: osmotically inducible protein OsmC [Sulfuricurvum sp. RIFOXYD12_FULL_44_77]OHD93559.1 MAG: osmotically inducible protein OsmC [Sulfuricurvum sp. RIFOXYD2_FULL_44_160]DAB38978.1 MAG TPA: osmotically inducible protein OsmC [Sulfuricurvum kujiense]